MVQIKTLEKFEREFNAVYQTYWVATSENGNYFRTNELEYTEDNRPDIKNTKWTHISNPTHLQITEQMKRTKVFEYQKQPMSSKVLKKPKNKDMGMSM